MGSVRGSGGAAVAGVASCGVFLRLLGGTVAVGEQWAVVAVAGVTVVPRDSGSTSR